MKNSSRYWLDNSSSSKDNGRWDWAVWLEGDEEALSGVSLVEYFLHPTFKNPHREIRDQDSKFLLKSSGWGEFLINAKIHTTDGQVVSIDHWLKLGEDLKIEVEFEPSKSNEDSGKTSPRNVFISHSSTDSVFARKLGDYLRKRGVTVSTGSDIGIGESIEQDLKVSIGRSDAVVALVPQDPGPWVEAELEEAKKQRKPVISFVFDNSGENPQLIKGLNCTFLGGSNKSGMVEAAIKTLDSNFNY